MNSLRSVDLQRFLDAAQAAIRHGAGNDPRIGEPSERMLTALRAPPVQVGQPQAGRLPVCHHISDALEHARHYPGPVGDLADAFATIEPSLCWKTRPGAETHGDSFLNGHANATIAGSDALEIRHDIIVGVSLMAPETQYPDHRHPPEEIYIVLSGGQWRQADGAWHEPGIGGLVYNPPNIVHAMRATNHPLLALWFLRTEPG